MRPSLISITKSFTNNNTQPSTHGQDTTARRQHIKRAETNTRPTNYPAPAPQSHSQGSTALHVKAKTNYHLTGQEKPQLELPLGLGENSLDLWFLMKNSFRRSLKVFSFT